MRMRIKCILSQSAEEKERNDLTACVGQGMAFGIRMPSSLTVQRALIIRSTVLGAIRARARRVRPSAEQRCCQFPSFGLRPTTLLSDFLWMIVRTDHLISFSYCSLRACLLIQTSSSNISNLSKMFPPQSSTPKRFRFSEALGQRTHGYLILFWCGDCFRLLPGWGSSRQGKYRRTSCSGILYCGGTWEDASYIFFQWPYVPP